jgi:hypothetical protein
MTKKTKEQYFNQFLMGAMMGGAVGCTVGFIVAHVGVILQGLQGQGYLRTVSRCMAQIGGSFALFMGVGSVIRNDHAIKASSYTPVWQKFQN